MTNTAERQFISKYRPYIFGERWRSRFIVTLTLVSCVCLLLAGCGRSANKNVELVKRIDGEELGCFFYPSAFIQREGLAYATSGGNLTILDVSNPLYPRCLSTYDTTRGASDIALDGQYAFLAAQGLIVMDISNPGNPQELYRYIVDSAATDIKLKDNYAYVAAVGNGLLIFDVSNPEQPELVSQMTFSDAAVESPRVNVTAIDFVGEYAYVLVKGDYPFFFAILDVTNPASPKVVRRYVPESEHNPWDIVVDGEYAYLNGLLNYIEIADVSDPLAPRLLGSVNTPGNPRQHVVDGDLIFVADSYNISVINASNPAKPRVVGFYDISGASHVEEVGDYLYAVGQTPENGQSQPPKLHIFRFVS